MKKLISIDATFANRRTFEQGFPVKWDAFYLEENAPINAEDDAKIKKILDYFDRNSILPMFHLWETPADANTEMIGCAVIDLGIWSRNGLPTFDITDRDGKSLNLPRVQSGRKSKN